MSQNERAHIFCVNGSPDFLDLLREFFQTEHFDVTTTNFVPRTYDQIAALQPDLLLIDLVIGQTVGWELLERLQLEALTNRIPVIVASTNDDLLERARQNQARYGAEYYILKPLDLDDLLAAVNKLLGARLPLSER